MILLQFLSDKNYPKMLTPRALQTPSTKEFLHILNVSVNINRDILSVGTLTLIAKVPHTIFSCVHYQHVLTAMY